MPRKPDPPMAEAWDAEPWHERYALCLFNLWAAGFLTDQERTSAYNKLLAWQAEHGIADPLNIESWRGFKPRGGGPRSGA